MACSCGANKTSFTQIVQRDGSSLPSLKYWHCKYQQQFEALFAMIGLPIKEVNLPDLAKLSDTGGDRAGVLKDAKGNPIYFSVEDTLKKIDLSKISSYTCSI